MFFIPVTYTVFIVREVVACPFSWHQIDMKIKIRVWYNVNEISYLYQNGELKFVNKTYVRKLENIIFFTK
jgi:hypothetical protein